MDNVIYTYYVYRDTKTYYSRMLVGLFVLIGILFLVIRQPNVLILSFLALFSLLQMFIGYVDVCNDLIERNRQLRIEIRHFEDSEFTEELVRDLQDCIVQNRDQALFIRL